MGVFEELKDNLGCEYISDLRFEPYCTKAKLVIKTLDIGNYSFTELNDLTDYFYGQQFASKEAAICFLKG